MPRGTVLTPDVERIIGDVYTKHPELRAKPQRFYEEVYRRVHERVDWAEPNWPGFSVVKQRLAKLREKDRNRSPESTELDEAWYFCHLSKYPISPEALPLVMSIALKCAKESGVHHSEAWMLTIREALSIAKLYKAIEFFYHKNMEKWANPDNAELVAKLIRRGDLPENYQQVSFEDVLLDWAYAMASEEEYEEFTDEPYPSPLYIGERMMGNIFEYHGQRLRDFIDEVTDKYDIHHDKYKELVSMPVECVHQFFDQLAKRKEEQNERKHKAKKQK